jgi:hypothetical protein
MESLESIGQLENTYIIYASDNGGCPIDGGYNSALRGTKGTLFEGGVKVDAFIYHQQYRTRFLQGDYTGLMHVSDWFPTILSLAKIHDYRPHVHRIEGYNHHYAWFNQKDSLHQPTMNRLSLSLSLLPASNMGPREYLLYNLYHNVEGVSFDPIHNQSFAIRDQRYKLIHTFVNTTFSHWYTFDDSDQSTLLKTVGATCTEEHAMLNGTFDRMLFDLIEDPYEKVNLYNDPNYIKIKVHPFFEYQIY